MELLGDMVREKRINTGLTLRKFSTQLGVSPIVISQIENNKKVPLSGKAIERLSEFLKITFEEIKKVAEYTKHQIDLNLMEESAQNEEQSVNKLRFQLARTLMSSKIHKESIIQILEILKQEE